MPKIGDRYIIEIDRVYSSAKHKESRYGIKGFENFVLSERKIDQLLKHGNICTTDEAYDKGYTEGFEFGRHEATTLEYQKGLNDAWTVTKAFCEDLTYEEAEKCFGREACVDNYVFFSAKPEVRIDQLRAYEEQKKSEEAEIKAVDEITDGTFIAIVTFIGNEDIDLMWKDGSVETLKKPLKAWKKTGRHHQQLADLLKAMEESNG